MMQHAPLTMFTGVWGMKHALGTALATLVLAFSIPADAQVEDPYTVGDGRIGGWRVGSSETALLQDFTSRYGTGYRIEQPFPLKLTRDGKAYFWRNAGFQLTTFDGRVVAIVIYKRYTDPTPNAELMRYKTKEGIGIGEPLSRVNTAYPSPTRRFEVRWFNVTNTGMVWVDRGLYIEIRDGFVDAIGIFDTTAPWEFARS